MKPHSTVMRCHLAKGIETHPGKSLDLLVHGLSRVRCPGAHHPLARSAVNEKHSLRGNPRVVLQRTPNGPSGAIDNPTPEDLGDPHL